ncbi:CST complex subunit STN1 isoform X1 [Heptranchias perlo]|uniref:CST complex subunit STN1 isoform X1 n=1 Tax=Heptranchias perlo TaxID=212740 RepID=UPI00355ABD0F
MQSDCASAEDTVPAMLWGLDSVHGVFAKLYIRDILELKDSRQVPVDDGTGVISCVQWKKLGPTEGTKPAASPPVCQNLLEQLSRILRLERQNSQLELGDVVQVRGRVRVYRDQREINSTSICKVTDHVFAAQIHRMLELPHLYRTFYDKPCQIRKNSTEPNEEGLHTLSLQRKIKQFLIQNGVKNFYQRELGTVDSLVSTAQQGLRVQDRPQTKEEPPSSASVLKQIRGVFQDAIRSLQEEGVVFQKVSGPNELYLVTDEEKELHSVTLGIIRDDSIRPKHVDKGCPLRHILSCVQHGYSAGVTEATMQRVLDRLECDSNIISTMDRHYTAS